jgi:hypothetical protein
MTGTGFGLKPYRNLYAAAPNYQVNNAFQIAYNNSHSIGTGDIVIPLSTGFLDIASNQPSNPILGVYAYCQYPNPNNTIQPQPQRLWNGPSLASNVTVNAIYWDDPQIVFAVMASASLAQSSIGLNANFISNGVPNTTTGISILQLDASSVSTASNLPLRIVEFAPFETSGGTVNGPTSVNPVMGVTLNTAFAKAVTGV